MKFCLIILIVSLSQLSQAKVLEKIYAVVNGEIITLTEINDYQKKLRTGGFVNDLLFADPVERKKAIGSRDYLIKLLVDEKLIDYEVKQGGFLVTPERVNKEIRNIAQSKGLSKAQMKSALRQQGISFVEYQDFIKKSIERRQLVEKEITSKIKISEQDIVSHYLTKSKQETTQVFEYHLSHILLPKNKKTLAKEVANQAKNNFSSLVSKHSVDKDSKKQDGKFGVFKSGEMISSIENAIKTLEIGGTSQVVSTPLGLHIFKVTDKKIVNNPQIEKAKQRIYQTLFARAFKEQLKFWLIQKRKEAIIQINKS